MKAAGIAQNCHILVFFREFWRGKDDLRVRKDDFDAVFFLSATPRLAESESRRLAESGSRQLVFNASAEVYDKQRRAQNFFLLVRKSQKSLLQQWKLDVESHSKRFSR